MLDGNLLLLFSLKAKVFVGKPPWSHQMVTYLCYVQAGQEYVGFFWGKVKYESRLQMGPISLLCILQDLRSVSGEWNINWLASTDDDGQDADAPKAGVQEAGPDRNLPFDPHPPPQYARGGEEETGAWLTYGWQDGRWWKIHENVQGKSRDAADKHLFGGQHDPFSAGQSMLLGSMYSIFLNCSPLQVGHSSEIYCLTVNRLKIDLSRLEAKATFRKHYQSYKANVTEAKSDKEY